MDNVPSTGIPEQRTISGRTHEQSHHKFYGVRRGRIPGVYCSWPECVEMVHGFPNSSFKGFATKEEAESFVGKGNEKG